MAAGGWKRMMLNVSEAEKGKKEVVTGFGLSLRQ